MQPPKPSAPRRQAVTAYVALGANLGDARATVLRAMDDLAQLPRTQVTARSGLWRSAPVDAGGPDFINAVAELRTSLAAPDLLHALQQLENAAGRQRPYPNAPRTLDLDLLLYGSTQIQSERLTVPHPRMSERAFVLKPLADIAPDLVAPQELARLAGQRVERL